MHAMLPLLDQLAFPAIRRGALEALQINLTYRCNQRCLHCHVNAGPTRTEAMTDDSLALLHQVIDAHPVHTLDLTGGAPEMHPRFREIVQHARREGLRVPFAASFGEDRTGRVYVISLDGPVFRLVER